MTYAFDGERAARGEIPRRGAQGGESEIEVHEPTVVVENMRRCGALIEVRCAAMAEAGTPGDWQQASDEAQRALVELRRVGRQLRAAGAEGETPARAEASRTAAEILSTAEQRMAEAPESPARAAAAFARTDEVVACFARAGESSAREGFAQVERQFRALLPTLSAPELRQLRAATRDADHAVARAFATVTPERRDRMTEALFAPKLAFAAEVRDVDGAGHTTSGVRSAANEDRVAAVAADVGAPLGVTPTIVRGDEARRITERESARGVAESHRIAIHPAVDPDSRDGREVIAHEVVHLAQARLPDDGGEREDAEDEAGELAAQVSDGAALTAPTARIDLSHPAADNGRRRGRRRDAPPPSRVIEPRGPISTAARDVVDARDGLHVATQLGRPIDAPLSRLNQTIDGLADVLHRNAGDRSAADDRAIEIALEAAGGAANLLVSRSGPRSKAEGEIRHRIQRVRAAAADAQARDATLESSTEVARMVAFSHGELTRVRGVAGQLISGIRGLTVDDLRGIDRALAETTAWREEIAASPTSADRLARAAIDQQAVLIDAVPELSAALAQPVTATTAEVVRAYFEVIASSTERKALSAPRLERARRLRRRLPLDRAESVMSDSDTSTRLIAEMDPEAGDSARRKQGALAKRHRELDAQVVAGQRVSADDVEALVGDTREFEFLRRVDVLRLQAQGAHQAIEAVRANHTVETVRAERKLDDLMHALAGMRGQYDAWLASVTPDDPTDAEVRAAQRTALDGMEQRLARLLKEEAYEATLNAARRVIQDEQSDRMIEAIVLTIALTVAGNFLAAAVRGAAEGAYLARAGVAAENGALSLRAGATAARVGEMAGMAADGAWSAVTQKYLMGDDVSLATLLAVNVVTAASVDRVMRMGRASELMSESEQRAMRSAEDNMMTARWMHSRGMLVLAKGATIPAEMITGAAVDYAMRRALDTRGVAPSEQTVTEWLMQGASIALGRHLSQNVAAVASRIKRIETWSRQRTSELGGHLSEVKALARQLEQGAAPDSADDVLRRYAALLDAENALLQDAMLAQVDHGDGPLGHDQLADLVRSNHRAVDELARIGADDGSMRYGGDGGAPGRASTTRPPRSRRSDGDAHTDREQGDGAPARDGEPATHVEPPRAAGDGADRDVATTRVTTASMVPGSEFRGARGAHDPDAVLAASDGAFASAMRAVGAVQRIEPGVAPHTFVVTVPRGRSFSVRIMTAPLEQAAVARTLINTTKRGVTTVERAGSDGAAATRHDVMVEGRFVIQLSDGLDPAHVERALVHEGREILAERDLADGEVGARADALVEGPLRPGAVLSPHDLGRVAELNYLSASARDPARAESAQREVLALIDHLGLREGAVGADERRLLVHDHLSEPARRALDGLRAETVDLPAEAASQLAQVRDVAAKDATERAADAAYRAPLHETPVATTAGSKVSASERSALAAQAAAARAERSRTTVAAFRAEAAALPAGRYPTVDSPLVGAGAALAGRRTDQLVVDDRGRWQADAAARIAQTAQQLGPLVDAGLGDPFQFASPTERVPMEAVRYWEDSIAAQGPVIDGRGTLKFADDGKVLLEVMPSEGPPPITLEVTGIPVQASGFPRERVPGMTFGKSPTQALTDLDKALSGLAGDADHPLQAQASEARGRLRAISGAAKDDAGLAAQIFGEYPALRTALAGNATVGPATKTLEAYGAWDEMRSKDLADGSQRVFMGDEANLATFDPTSADSWVIAGTGGTGISAAEIILEKNPKAHVTMVGMDQPAGLMENDQARRLVTKHGDAATVPEGTPPGDGRFHLKSGVRVNAPKELMVDGQRQYEVWSDAATGESIHGEGYIAAIGREGELPPAIHELAWRAHQEKPKSVSAEPLFDADRQYLGYRLVVSRVGQDAGEFDITGAASRYAPPRWVTRWEDVAAAIDGARGIDAPPEGGNFDGGFVASATQAAKHGRFRRADDKRRKRGGEK